MRLGPGSFEGGGDAPRISSIFRTHSLSAPVRSRPLAMTSSRSSGYSLITAQPSRDRCTKYATSGRVERQLLPRRVMHSRRPPLDARAPRGRPLAGLLRFCATALVALPPCRPPPRSRLSSIAPSLGGAMADGPWFRGPPHRRITHIAKPAGHPRRVGIFFRRSPNLFFLFRCDRDVSGHSLFMDE